MMTMAAQYHGYSENGKVTFDNANIIPQERKRITVIFHDNLINRNPNSSSQKVGVSQIQARSQKQLEAFDEFMAELESITDEPITDESMSWLANNRVNFRRKL